MGFFKKNKDNQPILEGKDSAVSSDELFQKETNSQDSNSEDEIITELSLHPSWNISKEDQYSYQFLNLECPPLQPNQLSLAGISIAKTDNNDFQVQAFIRNSLDKAIKLEETTLVLLSNTEQIIGRKVFNLSDVGEIPAKSSRPWTFIFTKKDLFSTEPPAQGWKLAFQLKPAAREHSLELADTWKASLSNEDKKKLEEMVKQITPPKPGEVNFMGLQAKNSDNGDLHITLLIRNGSEKNINLEQIPLQVEDAAGDIVAKGGFKLEKFEVRANTSKPWTFIFPESLVTKKDADFSRWKAYAPQN